jgi:Secretion system C-terminal sorting domain
MLQKAINLSCFFFLSTPLISQVIYERTFPHEFPSIHFPIELSDTSTFSLGTNSDCGGIGSRHIDVNGNERMGNRFWAEAFSSGYYWIGHDSVLIWAEEGALDAGRDSFRVYIWTPDEINKILSIGIRDDFSNSPRYGAYLYSPGRLVYEKTDTLYTKDLSSGQVEDSLIFPDIYHIIEFEKSILVFSDNESPLLLNDQLEDIYEWQDPSSLPFNISESVVLDSFLVGMEESNPLSLGVVNVYNESLAHIDLSSYFDQIEEIQSNKNNLFVKGISNGEHLVLQLDNKFTFVDLLSIAFPELDKQMTYQYYPDRVYAWGYDGLANYRANYRMSYKYLDAGPIEYRDIELDTMWVDSVYTYAEHYLIVHISSVVRNLSPETIHSYTMHYEEIPIFFCDPGVYAGSFDDLTIEPSVTDTLSFQVWTYQYGSTFSRRFYVHHGSYHLDDQAGNNNFFLVHLLSSSHEPVLLTSIVYPNPFTDFLQVADVSESIQMDLYDQTGRMVSSGYGRLDNLGRLPIGVYLLQILDGNSISVRKVVKVE